MESRFSGGLPLPAGAHTYIHTRAQSYGQLMPYNEYGPGRIQSLQVSCESPAYPHKVTGPSTVTNMTKNILNYLSGHNVRGLFLSLDLWLF